MIDRAKSEDLPLSLTARAKSLVKGCGSCIGLSGDCRKGVLCFPCKSKISATLECLKEELEFLINWYSICCYKSDFKDTRIEERISQIKEAIKILSEVGK